MRDRYACENKHTEARVPIWNELLRNYKGGFVLIMPERTRRELDVVLAKKYGISPQSVAAYVANAHR